jgi:hypothetical protein
MCTDSTALNTMTDIHCLVAMILIRDLSICSGRGRGFPKDLVFDTTKSQAMCSAFRRSRWRGTNICPSPIIPSNIVFHSNQHEATWRNTLGPQLAPNVTALKVDHLKLVIVDKASFWCEGLVIDEARATRFAVAELRVLNGLERGLHALNRGIR